MGGLRVQAADRACLVQLASPPTSVACLDWGWAPRRSLRFGLQPADCIARRLFLPLFVSCSLAGWLAGRPTCLLGRARDLT